MTIQTRKPKINTTKVYPLDFGEWTHYEVQGSDGKYHTYVPPKPIKYQSWTLTSKQAITYYEYKVTCHSKADPKKFPVCKGNSNGTVCYHCLAAIKDRVGRRDKVLSLPENGKFNSAVKLLNFGGQLVKIVNQNGKAVWGTVR
jgi:hypothetical protein